MTRLDKSCTEIRGEGGAIKLIDQESIAAGELLGRTADLVGKIEGFLVDQQLLEVESHLAAPGEESSE